MIALVLLVDAANVVGSRPDGWWKDRAGAARRLTDRVRRAVAAHELGAPVVLVLEGRARAGAAEGEVDGVEVVHAPHDGDAAILDLVVATEDQVTVVTADRALAERVRSLGGEVVGPTWLLSRLES